MNIAVLASDAEESAHLSTLLAAGGMDSHTCRDFSDLLAYLSENRCELLVLALPALGRETHAGVQAVRALLSAEAPILLLATAAAEGDLLAALSGGADDYLLKPLRRAELIARIRVLLKRSYPEHPNLANIVFDHFAFDARLLRVTTGDKTAELTRKEFELALLLFRHLGRPLSRAYILDMLWPGEADQPSRTLDTHISRVRNKLGLRPENGYRLNPVYSYGYLLERIESRLSSPSGDDGMSN